MSQDNLRDRAKQGDPQAIAILLSQLLNPKGITVTVSRQQDCLQISLESDPVVPQEKAIGFIQKSFSKFEVMTIARVEMYGKKTGKTFPVWDIEFSLDYAVPSPKLDDELGSLTELKASQNKNEDINPTAESKDGLHQVGEVIEGRYHILDVLGQGGNGITYAAEDMKQNKKVAIKALSLRHMNEWKQIELFEREAKVLSQLNHPAIPKYFDFFTIDTEEDRAFYIVQELAQGQNLAKLIEAGWRTNEKGIKKIAEQVLNILIYLHGLSPSVIHRDIKPHNLIYGDDGKVSLVDFGAVQDTYRSTMARGSTVIGTFGYMAPEQFRGQAVLATDLFSLGATILFILTHRSPSELPQERLRYDFRSKIKVSEQFADWLQKMVEPDLDDRFTSASESLAALQKKQIVWFPRRRLSWQAWVAIAGIGSILIAFTVTNKWLILSFYDIYPKICTAQGNETNKNLADIQELVEYAKQSRNLSNKFPSQATEGDRCLTTNFNAEILDIFHQRGVQLDYVQLLSIAKSEEAIDWLILKNVDINTRDNDGRTAINFAVIRGDINIVKFLIKKGANVDNQDSNRETPLSYAVLFRNPEIIRVLIDKGVNINNRNTRGETPLHYAVGLRNPEIIALLIKNGAEISAKDNSGYTPLDEAKYCAVKSGLLTDVQRSNEVIKILVKNGAHTNEEFSNLHTSKFKIPECKFKTISGYAPSSIGKP